MKLPAVDGMVRCEALLHVPETGPEAHAGLLKCLLMSGQRRNPTFWLQQLDLLGDDYGALIFGALTEHGLEVAARSLPRCCRSDMAINEICLFLPALVDRFGVDQVRNVIEMQRGRLPKNVYQELAETVESMTGHSPVRQAVPRLMELAAGYAEAAMWGVLLENPKRLLSDRATLHAWREMGLSEEEIQSWIQGRESK